MERARNQVNVGTQADLDYNYTGFEFSCEHENIPDSNSAHAATSVSVADKESKNNFDQNLKRPIQVLWQWQ